MKQACYTYHVRVTQEHQVHVELRDPQMALLGRPSGQFRYLGETKVRLQALCQAASLEQITGNEIRELGQMLTKVLLDELLLREFFFCYERARREGALLRLELDIDEHLLPEVAALPWEWMYLPASVGHGSLWFATDPALTLVRRRQLWQTPVAIPVSARQPLRIALAISAPEKLGAVKYEQTWEMLQNLARDKRMRFELLNLVRQATKSQIDGILEQQPQLFHYIGHSRFKNEQGQEVGEIALCDDIGLLVGEPLWCDAEEFGGLFLRHRPNVVVLQACESGKLSASRAFVGIVSQLVQQYIPMVVAMQYEISNVTAQRFTAEFYKRIAAGDPVDKAVQEGRRAIALGPQAYRSGDFATPVLFMGVQDGHLFSSLEAARPTKEKIQPGSTIIQAKNGGFAIGRMEGNVYQYGAASQGADEEE